MESIPQGVIPEVKQVKPKEVSFAEKAKNRDSKEHTTANFGRMMQAVKQVHEQQMIQKMADAPFLKRLGMRGKLEREWQEKIAVFDAYFKAHVWSTITHVSSTEIPPAVPDSPEVILKSPAALAKEHATTTSEQAKYSSALDERMGSTEFVFAGLSEIPSRSMLGKYDYHIDPKTPGVVVPIDIADLTPVANTSTWEATKLETYVQNVLETEQFYQFYPQFAALFFDKPEEAIEFFKEYYSGGSMHSEFWYRNNERVLMPMQSYFMPLIYQGHPEEEKAYMAKYERENSILVQMRDMYKQFNVCPPFAPEFQYREAVKATAVHRLFDRKGFDIVFPDYYSNNPDPQQYLDFLKLDPQLKDLFGKSVGVFEGYTLEEHTLMALKQFERYFGPKDAAFPWRMRKQLFRVMLALHDTGKPEALKEGHKDDHHKESVVIMKKVLGKLEFSSEEIQLATALVDGDPIGACLRGWGEGMALQELEHMFGESGLQPEMKAQFFDLVTVFFRVDAGSYTADAGGYPSLDSRFVFDHEKPSLEFGESEKARVAALKEKFLQSQKTDTFQKVTS